MKDTEVEEWVGLKQGVKDTYSNYLISSLGRVFNTKSGNFVSHVITGEPQYFYVNIKSDQGSWRLRRVHNIMGWSFLGDMPNKGDTIDHIDRNKYNNSLDNLRWLCKSGQGYNRDVTPDGNEDIRNMLLEMYDRSLPIHEYVYRLMTIHNKTLEDSLYQWANYIKPDIKIKELMFTPSVEISGVWYPDKSTVSKMHGISLPKVKEGVLNNLSLEEMKLSKYDPAEVNRFSMDGYWMTRVEHCERLYVSYQRVTTKMTKFGYSFEDAIKLPIERVNKHWVNGVVYRNKELFEKYNLPARSANSHLARVKDRTIRCVLEHYGVDTSDMEIYPCDGKDIIMYNKPI